ncbi:aminotransferase class I/II-fold pyridoxal phosphate-dependent enzyme, partial [Deinococcus sp.]|uniref:aminotransferase class I/II-fold pyridoxal phosphate-dependent enzyme n=1 Tax=Deinococcus sp. TaxID=47478 RepID=UPI0025BCC8D6
TFTGTPPHSFAAHVNTGKVLSLGSFSKILAPGSRLGWIQAAPELLSRLIANGMIASGGGFSPLGGALIRSMFELDLLPGYVQGLRDTFRGRAAALGDALDDLRPLGIEFQRPSGGYFIWVTLPDGLDSVTLLDRAVSNGVRYQPGPKFSPDGGQRGQLRLCFAYYAEEDLRGGVRRLGQALQETLREG